jgi:cytidine deaminase
MYSGSNVEAANYSLTKHAEEAAILAAIAAEDDLGRGWLRALYVAGLAPCGSCRQFATEFATADALNRLKGGGSPEVSNLADLLPGALRPEEVSRRRFFGLLGR